MYWFAEPVQESVDAWNRLADDSFQWGRGPIIAGVRRPLMAFFRPVKGYAASSALVSADALPYRPNTGLHLKLTHHEDPYGVATHDRHAHDDRVLVPALLDVEGVAGAWTFSFSRNLEHETMPVAGQPLGAAGSLRLRILYLDGDDRATSARIAGVEDEDAEGVPGTGEVLISTPLESIDPWSHAGPVD
jgi:hypothetical protein